MKLKPEDKIAYASMLTQKTSFVKDDNTGRANYCRNMRLLFHLKPLRVELKQEYRMKKYSLQIEVAHDDLPFCLFHKFV